MSFLKIFQYLCLALVMKQVDTISTDNESYWYPSSPIASVDQPTICEDSSGVNMIKCLYPPFEKCCAIYSKECGLKLLCIGQDNKIERVVVLIKDLFIQEMLIQPNTANLWVANPTHILLFDISDPLNQQVTQKAITQINKEPQAGVTLGIQYFSSVPNRLFLSNSNAFHVYNIQIPSQISFVQTITTNSKAQSLTVAPEIQKIFMVDGTYRVLKITSSISDLLNKPELPIAIQDQCTFPFSFVILNEVVNSQYLIVQTTNSIVGGLNLSKFLSSGDCKDLKFQSLFSNGDTYLQAIMTPNKKYVIIGLNYICLQIIEMSYNPLQAKLFQRIAIVDYVYFFQLSQDQQHVIISSKYSIDIYQRKKSNYNLINPSILNLPQIIVYNEKFVNSPQYPYSCEYTPLNNYLLFTKGADGMYIFKEDPDSHFLRIKNNVNPPNFTSNLRMVRSFNGDNNIMIGRDSSIFIYDISDISNPIFLSSINLGFKGIQIRQGYITKDMKHALLSGDQQGVLIVDISDLKAPKFISQIYHGIPIITRLYHVDMPTTEKYAIGSYQNQGLVFYDVSDFSHPSIISYFTTQGGYTTIFMQNENYMVQADLLNGIKIVDVSDVKNPVMFSSLRMEGSTKECVLIKNDQFLLCTARYRGQLLLVDLRDLKRPYILQKFQYKEYYGGFCVCASTDHNYIYIGLLSALVRLNLYPAIYFEMDLLLLQRGNTIINQFLDTSSEQPLQVGMKVKVTLSQVYIERQANIRGAAFYNDFKIQELPFWATYSVVDSSLIILFDKNALTSSNNDLNKKKICDNNQGQYQGQTQCNKNDSTNSQSTTPIIYSFQFIFIISEQITSIDFINTNLAIDSIVSGQIFNDCILVNLIDHNYYFVDSSYDIAKSLLLQKAYPTPTIDFIFYVLSRKNTYYPILLKVQNSLVVEVGDLNTQPQVQSVNDYIYLELSVDNKLAQFIPFAYGGVLTFLSDKRDWMKIEGDLISINTIIQKGIHLANFTNPQDINISISFDDAVNFVITKTILASQQPIISLNQHIKNNPELTLQDDFEKKFAEGKVYILDTFSYTFNSLVFINPDNRLIQYEAFLLESDGQYIPLPQQYWLLFQKEERTFVGTTKSSQYGESIKIMVNATDGYTFTESHLTIHIKLVPISYVLILLFQIISPIVGLLGFWKYRSSFYNMTQVRKFATTRIEAAFGEEIIFQIPLLGNKLKIAQELWKVYFKSINKNDIINEFNQDKTCWQAFGNSSNNNINSNIVFFHQTNFNNEQAISTKAPPLQLMDRTLSSPQIQSKSIVKFQRQFVRNYANSFKKRRMNSSNPMQKQSDLEMTQQLQQIQQLEGQSQVTLNYFNIDNTINKEKIIKNVLEQYKKNHIPPDQKIIDQLNNPLSMLFRAISGLAAISFTQQVLDKSIEKAINYLKLVAKQQGFKETDWYKYYAEILPQSTRIHIDQFPLIQINEELLINTIQQLFSSIGKQEIREEFKQKLPFVKDVINAIALGFTLDKRGIIPKIRGECLEIKPHHIQSIKTFRPIHSKSLCFQRKKSNETLVAKEFQGIQEIPSWVQSVDLANKVILIKGKTEHKDIGEYVLNIYNNSHFIIKQIRIVITGQLQRDNQIFSPTEQHQSASQLYQNLPIQSSQPKQILLFTKENVEKYTEEEVPLESGYVDNRYFEKSNYTYKSNQGQLNLLTDYQNSTPMSPIIDSNFKVHKQQESNREQQQQFATLDLKQ